jgi:hypothetical protein
MTGNYTSTSDVTLKNVSGNTQTNSSITLPLTTSVSVFLVKYDSSGLAQWATYLDGTAADVGYSLAIDSSNNLYMSGVYTSSSAVTLKNVSGNTQTNSSITLPSTSSNAVFLVKYDTSGVVQWATYLDGTIGDYGYSLAIDLLNNIYMTGLYTSSSAVTLINVSGNTQIGSSITLPLTSSNAVFLVKYNSSGIAQWATCVDGINSDQGNSLLMHNNALYLTGSFNSTSIVTLKNVSGNTQTNSSNYLWPKPLNATTGNAMFLIKYI